MFRVVLADANVLYGRTVRDYLLYGHAARVIDVRWSETILGEVHDNLAENHGERNPNAAIVADRLIELLERHFPEAMVEVGPRDLAAFDAVTLPDPDDRHVLAAALAAEADIICTDDKTGFPAAAAAIAGVQVLTPGPDSLDDGRGVPRRHGGRAPHRRLNEPQAHLRTDARQAGGGALSSRRRDAHRSCGSRDEHHAIRTAGDDAGSGYAAALSQGSSQQRPSGARILARLTHSLSAPSDTSAVAIARLTGAAQRVRSFPVQAACREAHDAWV